ncbi:MAG: DUF2793 domain-containing protein [Pseudomonadota bacterium]
MDDTPNLDLPYLMPAQAQKHVTHNEALRQLDAIVQLSVRDRDLPAPPSSPSDGDRYIVAESGEGEWADQDGTIAAYQDGAWAFYVPNEGWLAWIDDEDVLVACDGSSWIAAAASSENSGNGGGSITETTMLGINAAADDTNRLSVSSEATLLNHEGDGHQLKINKASSGQTASLVYQNNFSGRAELGLAGNDDLSVKVSADGTTWQDSIVVEHDTGKVSLPKGFAAADTAEFAQADGGLWQRSADQSLNAVNWRHIVNQNTFDDGSGVDDEDYVNEVTAIGWNLSDTVGVAAQSNKAALFDTFEYKYNLAGKYVVERHMEMLDTDGERHRVFSWIAPHDGTSGSNLGTVIDEIVWSDFSSNVKIQWQLDRDRAFFGSPSQAFALHFETIGSPWGFQYSEAEQRYWSLPYFDNQSRLVLTGRQQANPGNVPAGEIGIAYNWNAQELNHGSTMFAVEGGTQTDSTVYGVKFDVRANWTFHNLIRNNDENGGTEVRIQGGGDTYMLFADTAETWLIGRRATSGDFVIGSDPHQTDEDILTINKTRGSLEPKNPPKLPSYSVSSLPSASTYGAGSLIFVTDENAGAVTAFSDGTSWRRTTDRSVVS